MKCLIPGMTLLALMLPACKRDEKTSESGQKMQTTPHELRGTWLSDCMSTKFLNTVSSQREFVINAIGDFDRMERYYNDPNCQQLVATYKVIGTLETKGPNPDNPNLNMINFTVNEAFITVTNASIIEDLNQMKLCGRTAWQVAEPVHVTHASCEGSKVQKGGVQFDSYALRNGQLYFGGGSLFLAKDNASERPSELDESVPYSRR